MAADASIYGQIQPVQAPNRLAMLAQAMQVQGLQGQNELAQYGLRKAQRSDEETNALARALQGGLDLSTPEGQRQAYSVAPTIAPTYIKTNLDSQTARANLRKAETEATTKAVELHRQALPNDPQSAAAWVQAAYNNPDLKPLTSTLPLDQAIARIPTDPEGFSQWRNQMALGMTKYVELNKPQISTQDLGGQSRIVATPGLGGAPQVLVTANKTQTPDSIASNATSTANNLRTVQASRDNAAATREVAQATRDAATIQTGFQNEQHLRKEFEALPEVKNYKQAYPSYAGIVDAAKRSTPMSDINIVYGLAKLYDPNSVVREGEYATVANSPAIPERVKGWAQYLAGGGKLTPEVKRQILAEAESRIASYGNEYEKAANSYGQVAAARGMKAESIFPATGDFAAGGKRKAKTVDLGALPSGGGKVVDFGSLK